MKILIVGASFAGVGCARTLIEQKSGHEVTIVDPRNYVEATIVQATVTRLESKEAGLSNGGTVSFDICVICCGSSYSNKYCKDVTTPKYEDRVNTIVTTAARVKSAKTILVIGGGLTGIEMAAEAVEAAAGAAAVTLVHSGTQLGASDKQHAVLVKRLEKLGVSVVLGKRVQATDNSGKSFKWEGTEAQAFDEVFWCTGNNVDTAFAKGLGNVCGEEGHFKVEGHPHIFAAGDCIRVDDTQLAYLAGQHGELAAKNAIKFAANPQARLKSWKPNGGTKVNAVGLGKKNVLVLFETGVFTCVPGAVVWFKGSKGKAMLGF